MSLDIPQTLMDNWHYFINAGVTEKFNYQEMGETRRLPGGETDTPLLSETELDVVFDNVGKFPWLKLDDETILLIDKVVIFPTLVLPVVPKINDILVSLSSSIEWKVKGLAPDPAKAHWELWVRPYNDETS